MWSTAFVFLVGVTLISVTSGKNNSHRILVMAFMSHVKLFSCNIPIGADPIPSEAFIFRVGTTNPLCWVTILNEDWVRSFYFLQNVSVHCTVSYITGNMLSLFVYIAGGYVGLLCLF